MEKRFTKWKESFHHPDSSAGRSSYGKPFCPFSGQNFSAPQLRPPCFAWPDSCPPLTNPSSPMKLDPKEKRSTEGPRGSESAFPQVIGRSALLHDQIVR